MKTLAIILALAASALLPATGVAHKRHHHHHAKHAHAAWVVSGGCENAMDAVPWSQWREDMAAAGFTSEEIEELEVCGD